MLVALELEQVTGVHPTPRPCTPFGFFTETPCAPVNEGSGELLRDSGEFPWATYSSISLVAAHSLKEVSADEPL
jgi:hypothetical protein